MKKSIWLTLIITEIAYIVFATIIAVTMKKAYFASESIKSLLRVGTLLVYVPVYLKYFRIVDSTKSISKSNNFPLFVSIIILFAFPFLFQKSGFTGPLRILWLTTSFIVGFREEMFYRGIIQTYLSKRFGLLQTILITSVLFTIYHFYYFLNNAQWYDFLEVFLWSIAIGIIYFKSNSYILVALIHSIYDAIAFITPIRAKEIPYYWGLAFILIAIGISSITLIKRKET